MLQSMTGYGEAVYEAEGLYFTAQVKTVNNKFLKTTLRLSESISFLEEEVEKLIRSKLFRGSVYLTVQVKSSTDKPLTTINTAAVRYYAKQLVEAIDGLPAACNVNTANLLNLPGVIEPYQPDEALTETIKNAVLNVVKDALSSLTRMRLAEGKQLADDLLGNCKNISGLVENIAARSPVVVEEYREKLQKRVNDLISSAKLELDEQILIREVAIYADRSDISEEIARLRSHLTLFEQACNSDQSVGRKLDFMCQEMFREVNTIGSKSSDSQISRWVVDMKCCVDRIKEQVQNVE